MLKLTKDPEFAMMFLEDSVEYDQYGNPFNQVSGAILEVRFSIDSTFNVWVDRDDEKDDGLWHSTYHLSGPKGKYKVIRKGGMIISESRVDDKEVSNLVLHKNALMKWVLDIIHPK